MTPPRPPHVPDRIVWIDGRLLAGAEALVSVFDRGVHDGEGLFETLRVRRGRPCDWESHLERMVLTAAELGFPVPPSPATLARALAEVLVAARLEDAAARITVTRGIAGGRPTRVSCWVEAEPLEARLWRGPRSGGARALVSKRAFEPGSLGRYKTTSRLAYHLAREEARAAGADEAILVSHSGEVLEGAVSNVFAVIAGEIVTPPLAAGILPGITRARVLELCARLGIPAREGRLGRADLARADEVFLTNSIQEVVPVATIDGAPVAGRLLTATLAAAYSEAIGTFPLARAFTPPRAAR